MTVFETPGYESTSKVPHTLRIYSRQLMYSYGPFFPETGVVGETKSPHFRNYPV